MRTRTPILTVHIPPMLSVLGRSMDLALRAGKQEATAAADLVINPDILDFKIKNIEERRGELFTRRKKMPGSAPKITDKSKKTTTGRKNPYINIKITSSRLHRGSSKLDFRLRGNDETKRKTCLTLIFNLTKFRLKTMRNLFCRHRRHCHVRGG